MLFRKVLKLMVWLKARIESFVPLKRLGVQIDVFKSLSVMPAILKGCPLNAGTRHC